MKNVAVLAMVGIFILTTVLSGCGKLSKKDFAVHVEEMQQEHEGLRTADSQLDQKITTQGTSLNQAIDQKTQDVRNEAITAAQQGDADTIKAAQDYAKKQDDQLRQDMTKAANDAGQQARQHADRGDQDLRSQIQSVQNTANSQAQTLSSLQANLTSTRSEITDAKSSMEQRKPRLVGTAMFASGRAGLSADAKKELDKAATAIKQNGDFVVKVVGHTDGRPVLSGRYRSNWDLSQARADAAAKYLKDQGVTNTIVAMARAHTQPTNNAVSQQGSSANRRVEVIIVPPGTVIE